ncbi:MAG TPA: DNA repair exonuclease [Thermoleophilia bacterium]|nr:DNA repair exonuclease [Thermoleophilia bacterium]
MPRILHTADIHLGKGFARYRDAQSRLADELRRVLPRLGRAARDADVDALVIAGDLFDSNAVGRAVRDAALSALREIAPLPVVIIPGTHDCLDDGSVYRRPEWLGLTHVRLFTDPEPSTKVVGEIAFHARVNTTNRNGASPLAGLRPGDARFNVAVAHGSFQDAMEVDENDYPITGADIQATGMDYVALGHWHTWFEVPGPLRALYCGAPQPFDYRGSGAAAVVDLVSGTIEPRPVASLRFAEAEAQTVPGMSADDVLAELRAAEGEPLRADVLRVTLHGTTHDPQLAGAVRERISDACSQGLFIEIDDSRMRFRADELDAPAGSVAAEFERILRARAPSIDDDLLDEAIAEGLWRLTGDQP